MGQRRSHRRIPCNLSPTPSDESTPQGFATRVLARAFSADASPTVAAPDSIAELWRRWTTCAAATAASAAVAVALLPSGPAHSTRDDASGWELQIEAWVLEQ